MINGIFIVLMMVLFLGVVLWAWSDRQKSIFERMAHLPLEDDDLPTRTGDKQ